MFKIGSVEFTWDEEKSKLNLRKHGIDFEEAATIFLNVPLQVVFDPDHSESEDRYIAIGISVRERVPVVVHLETKSGHVVRIISARRATRAERNQFLGEKK